MLLLGSIRSIMRICIRTDNVFFRKPTRPSLPLRKAPPFSPSLSSLRDERGCSWLCYSAARVLVSQRSLCPKGLAGSAYATELRLFDATGCECLSACASVLLLIHLQTYFLKSGSLPSDVLWICTPQYNKVRLINFGDWLLLLRYQ